MHTLEVNNHLENGGSFWMMLNPNLKNGEESMKNGGKGLPAYICICICIYIYLNIYIYNMFYPTLPSSYPCF